jgi:glycosyltransferase involved in cell wall biosynthesis
VLISVIVTAYNRENYLMNALKSLTNQDLSSENYEVIVVKNFHNIQIDNLINTYNFKGVLAYGTIGNFLSLGISHSSGDVITFLDDDDIFHPHKLNYLYNKFKADQ